MLEVDRNTFEEEVLQAEGYVVCDFYGNGCVPCEALMPHMEKLAEEYKDRMKFVALNTSKARRLAIGQKVLGLPTVVLYKDGEKLKELVVDDATPENIEAMIQEHL